MAKNKLKDLNDHLFAQLERLSEEGLSAEQLESEIDRSKAMAGLATQIVSNGRLVLDAARFGKEYGLQADPLQALSGTVEKSPR